MAGNGTLTVLQPALFVDAVDDEFVCSICLEIFVVPMQCKQGHVFCKACIEKTLKKKKQCPMDRSRLQVADLGRARAVENMISRKRVRCPHASQHTDDEDGCGWVGKVSERQKHLADECEHTLVPCPHDGCEVRVQRRVVSEHAASCEQRVQTCARCGKERAVSQRAQHEEECPMKRVTCPRDGCRMRPLRKEIAEHEAVCPMVQLKCVFEECGCTVGTLLRKDVAGHERDAAAVHAALALAAYNKAREREKLLEDTVKRTEKRLNGTPQACWRTDVDWLVDNVEAKIAKGDPLYSRCVTVVGSKSQYRLQLMLEFGSSCAAGRFRVRVLNRSRQSGEDIPEFSLHGTTIELYGTVRRFDDTLSGHELSFVTDAKLLKLSRPDNCVVFVANLCVTPHVTV